MRLPGQRDVVGEAAGAGEQGLVLDAAHGLAAAEAHGIGFCAHRGPFCLEQ